MGKNKEQETKNTQRSSFENNASNHARSSNGRTNDRKVKQFGFNEDSDNDSDDDGGDLSNVLDFIKKPEESKASKHDHSAKTNRKAHRGGLFGGSEDDSDSGGGEFLKGAGSKSNQNTGDSADTGFLRGNSRGR